MLRRTSFLALGMLLVGAAASRADETPLELLRRLMAPPVAAINEIFKPRKSAAAATTVPLPRSRPTETDPIATGSPAPPPPPAPATAVTPLPDDALGNETTVPFPRLRPAAPLAAVATLPDATLPRLTQPPQAAASAAAPLLSYTPGNETTVPFPRLRPAAPFAAVASLPDASLPTLVQPPPPARSACGVALAMLGVEALPLAPVDEDQCGIAAPVAVASLGDGAVSLPTKAIVECEAAEALATWLHHDVQPTARSVLGEPLTGLRIAASYTCRNRNNGLDAPLSEHARGNAVDISAFRVGDRWIEVASGWDAGGGDAAFLRAIRESACGPFTTVLGPGADEYHGDHFHLDLAVRSTAGPSKGLFCQ
ncbi:MAG: extensin family protein [Bauldia sp.]